MAHPLNLHTTYFERIGEISLNSGLMTEVINPKANGTGLAVIFNRTIDGKSSREFRATTRSEEPNRSQISHDPDELLKRIVVLLTSKFASATLIGT